jgi:hypothetical protein
MITGKIYNCKCGKRFYKRPNWLYVYRGVTYCSYNCWREAGGGNKKYTVRRY